MTLTPEQTTFIEELQHGSSAIMLSAVAGSGKTTTMVEGVHALQSLPTPPSILCCAFNSKIAKELEEKMPSTVTTCTLNALGHRALRDKLGGRVKVDARKVGKLTSDWVNKIDRKDLWKPLKDLVSKAKTVGLSAKSPLKTYPLVEDLDYQWAALAYKHNIDIPTGERPQRELFNMARKILAANILDALQNNTIDFDDQLYLTVLLKARMTQYDIVFVDEAQDLSHLQHEMVLRSLAPTGS